MKKLLPLLLLLLLLGGCALEANGETLTPPTSSTAPTATPEDLTPTEAVTEAPTEPPTEPTEADVGLAGTVMELSQGLTATPGVPDVTLVISFPEVDLTGAPLGRRCDLWVDLDGAEVAAWHDFPVAPGKQRRVPLRFSFSRFDPDRTAVVTATLVYGDETLVQTAEVALTNYPDEYYALNSEDPRPYAIDVIRSQNAVVVYAREEGGDYVHPVKTFLCSTGAATPSGTYQLGPKREWGALYGGVYGQYISRITGDILFHSVPYTSRSKDSLETEEFNKLGTSASMGCVRLSVGDVKWIYDNCPEGTRVHIFDADEVPTALPEPLILDPEDPRSCWDPTDPDPENPWNQDN